MISLPVWLPGPIFLLERSLSLVPCSFQGSLSRCGVSVQGWGLCLRGSLSGGSCPRGGLCRETPLPESEKRAVRILLSYKKN